MVATGYLRCGPCRNPVRWHGVLKPTRDRGYRVFSCDEHADSLVDLYPASPRLHDGGPGMATITRIGPNDWEDDRAS